MIAKIAAGEVIERPAYAVKELVENSLDANPQTIRIEIENSGLKRIAVLDDGEGMNEEELLECFKPHTTSKIGSGDHLIGIKTFGFRGEALSSIAAISNLTIQSKTPNQTAGRELSIKAGIFQNSSPIGMPEGTRVIIEDLFYPVPARKKFLKSAQSEWRFILDTISNLALANLNVRFVLVHNRKAVFDLPQNQTFESRVSTLLGETLFSDMIPLDFEESYIKLNGFLGRPHLAASQQNKQYIFVNSRRVTDKLVSLAVKEAFGTLLPGQYFPVFLLSIKLPHEMVDVNIHPRKEQISFLPARQVFDAVQKGVLKTLLDNHLTYIPGTAQISATALATGEVLKSGVDTWNVFGEEFDDNTIILQQDNLYLITATGQGIRIYDQHACHERILFEQFMQEFKKQKKLGKKSLLNNAISMELSPPDSELLIENLTLFKSAGFEIEDFSAGHFKISSVPEIFKDRDIPRLIGEMLGGFKSEFSKKNSDDLSDEIIKFLACKSAIKAGDKLNSEQAVRLIKKLEKTPNKATCPHGRPTNKLISNADLDRHFRR